MKQTKASVWREYGLDVPTGKVRYQGNVYKAIYWKMFSIFVRIRDTRKYGTCISCGTTIEHWNKCDAGHYAAAQNCGISLLFDEYNVNAECPKCNAWDDGHLIGYRRNLIERRGEQAVRELETRYMAHKRGILREKEWTKDQYHLKIIALQARMADFGMVYWE